MLNVLITFDYSLEQLLNMITNQGQMIEDPFLQNSSA
jgi:hypothetical protein